MDQCWVEREISNDSIHIREIEDRARTLVINTMNLAKERIGIRQGLEELARTAAFACKRNHLSMRSIVQPIPITGLKFIIDAIESHWKLAKVFKYAVKYRGNTSDEAYKYYYFEAIFSQPRVRYPIPQTIARVFFRIDFHPTDERRAPMMFFRVEGQHTDHNANHVALLADWILALLHMKSLFFQRIESLGYF